MSFYPVKFRFCNIFHHYFQKQVYLLSNFCLKFYVSILFSINFSSQILYLILLSWMSFISVDSCLVSLYLNRFFLIFKIDLVFSIVILFYVILSYSLSLMVIKKIVYLCYLLMCWITYRIFLVRFLKNPCIIYCL